MVAIRETTSVARLCTPRQIKISHATNAFLVGCVAYSMLWISHFQLDADSIKSTTMGPPDREASAHGIGNIRNVRGSEKRENYEVDSKFALELGHHGTTQTNSTMRTTAENRENLEKLARSPSVLETSAALNILENRPRGAVILGMHRSGTSMLSGLLNQSLGYNLDGPLFPGRSDNVKGYFERQDVVWQNDILMAEQNVSWSTNVLSYDWERAIRAQKEQKVPTKYSELGLTFFNSRNITTPWLQKDPRMCITFRTWLDQMEGVKPAVIFTFRHPLEVATSLMKREPDFPLQRGLRLWIVYNMRAIQNSRGLCIVRTSSHAVLDDPLRELQRVADELTTKCKLPSPPLQVQKAAVEEFIDLELVHHRLTNTNSNSTGDKGRNKTCSEQQMASNLTSPSLPMCNEALRIYNDLISGEAFTDGYVWPVELISA